MLADGLGGLAEFERPSSSLEPQEGHRRAREGGVKFERPRSQRRINGEKQWHDWQQVNRKVTITRSYNVDRSMIRACLQLRRMIAQAS
jgi:hypothetical protein